MYKDKFVVSILYDGYPVKETGSKYNRQVAIPFDSEYKIRLKNKNKVSCTARVFIDGRKISQLGDIIIHAGGTVDLERYIDKSLNTGNKFKFVPIDHPDVDDPTSSENGIIKVEFRKAKDDNTIKIKPDSATPLYMEDNNGPRMVYNWWQTETVYNTPNSSSPSYTSNKLFDTYCNSTFSCNDTRSTSDVECGATVEGGLSDQNFVYSDLDVEDYPTILTLKLVGIRKNKFINNKYKYCTECGQKLRQTDRYCSTCGHRV